MNTDDTDVQLAFKIVILEKKLQKIKSISDETMRLPNIYLMQLIKGIGLHSHSGSMRYMPSISSLYHLSTLLPLLSNSMWINNNKELTDGVCHCLTLIPLTMIYHISLHECYNYLHRHGDQLSTQMKKITTLKTKLHNTEERLQGLQAELETWTSDSRCPIFIYIYSHFMPIIYQARVYWIWPTRAIKTFKWAIRRSEGGERMCEWSLVFRGYRAS